MIHFIEVKIGLIPVNELNQGSIPRPDENKSLEEGRRKEGRKEGRRKEDNCDA